MLARASSIPLNCQGNPVCEAAVGETGAFARAFDLVLSFNPGSGSTTGDIKGRTQGQIALGGMIETRGFKGRVSGFYQERIANESFGFKIEVNGNVQGGGTVILQLRRTFQINGGQLVWQSLQGRGIVIDVTSAG